MFKRQYQLNSGLALTCLALFGILLASIGCTQSLDADPAVRIVSLAEFSSAKQVTKTILDAEILELESASSERDTLGYAEPATTDTATSTQAAPSAESLENYQVRGALRLEKPGDRIVVDSFVGQVNGRPIYADDFLNSLEDRLVEVAAKTTGQARIKEFELIINDRLGRVVKNELILADAESILTEQEQLGLFAYLKSRQKERIRQTGSGDRYAAEDVVRRDSGIESLEELFDFERDQILINQLRRQKIEPRVIVSWRDIEQEYKRRFDEFNPPARVTLSMIRFNSTTEKEKIDEVTKRLEAGDDFTDIAHDLKILNDGVWDTFEIGEGGIAEIGVRDLYKEKLKGLGQGDTTDPIESETLTTWLHVKKVMRPAGRSLYDHDVQQQLAYDLHERRSREEEGKYIRALYEDGIFDELEDMGRRLVSIALQRYAK